MATTTANAIGTQQQFTASPQTYYEKRLVNVGAASVSAPADTDGLRLAQSLGVAANTINDYLGEAEKNKEKIGLARGEAIAASLTEDDWKTKSALQILARDSDFQTGDNPYAVALIEKMRGKYFSSKFDSEYQVWAKQQPPTKDSSAEAAQYQKYMQDRRQEVAAIAGEHEGFEKGYWDNFMPQTLQHVQSFLKQRSADLDSDRIGSTTALLGNLARSAYSMKPDEVIASANQIVSESLVANASHGEIQEQLKKFFIDHAERNGDSAFIKDAWEKVTWTDPHDGKVYKAGEQVDMMNAVKAAENAKRIRMDKETYDMQQKLLGMPPASMFDFMEKLKKEDNTMYHVMAPQLDTLIAQRKAAEERAAKQRLAMQQRAGAMQRGSLVVKNYLGLLLNGATSTADGGSIPATIGELKEKMRWTDAEGKSHLPENAEALIAGEIANQIEYIRQNAGSPEEVARQTMNVMRLGIAKPYVDGFKQQLSRSLGSLTPGAAADPSIQQAIVMMHTNMSDTKALFGSELSGELRTLGLLQDGTGDFDKAAELYANSKVNRENSELVRARRSELDAALPQLIVSGFSDLNGGQSDINQDFGTHWDMADRIGEVALSLRLAGYSQAEALSTAQAYAKQNYFSYMGTVIPKSMFDRIAREDKAGGGKEAINDCISMYLADRPDLTWDKVIIDYDEDHGVLSVRGGSYGAQTWGVTELTNYINNKGQANPNGTPYTAAGINAARDADEAQQQLPEGFYFGI